MTPHEKAVNAVNVRLEQLQAKLQEAKVEAAQRFLLESVFVTIAVAEALSDYIKTVAGFAQRRHAEVKQASDTLSAKHTEMLKSGQELLEKLKSNPTDRALRKEIDRAQQDMEALQKSVRRGANAFQRELAPSLAMVDQMADSVRRFCEAEQGDGLKRQLKGAIEHVGELYVAHLGQPGKGIIDTEAWEKSALAEIDQSADFYDAYARAGYQLTLALELIALAVSENPPPSPGDAAERANRGVIERVKRITTRLNPA